jgi:cadherin EGF LAG seven-pass G-type receptor 1
LCHRFLDLTGPLQLGGLPEELLAAASSDPSVSVPVQYHNFTGCISDLQVDHQLVDLNE